MTKLLEKQDYYGEKGCCLTCNETLKEYMQGLQREVWYKGKFYSCLCLEGKCSGCSWLYAGECQRKEFKDNMLPM
jgi:hypothetical protein